MSEKIKQVFLAAQCPGIVFLIDTLENDPLLGENIFTIGYDSVVDKNGILDEISELMQRFGAVHYPSTVDIASGVRTKRFFIGQEDDPANGDCAISALKWLSLFATVICSVTPKTLDRFDDLCAIFAKEIAIQMEEYDSKKLRAVS